jgi:hypothetical protein
VGFIIFGFRNQPLIESPFIFLKTKLSIIKLKVAVSLPFLLVNVGWWLIPVKKIFKVSSGVLILSMPRFFGNVVGFRNCLSKLQELENSIKKIMEASNKKKYFLR